MNQLPTILDNVNTRLIDDLEETIGKGSRVSIAAASFSIYAYRVLREELEKVDELRFIFTSPTFIKDKEKKEKREFYIPKLNRERNLYGSDFEIKLRNELSQKAIARECAEWIKEKATFKTNTSQGTMMGLVNVESGEDGYSYYPFNDFTTTALGCGKDNNISMPITKLPTPFAKDYLKSFDALWCNDELLKDVTDTIIDNIATVYQENSPEFVYFITLYNIFKDFLDDVSDDELPNEKTGFKDSKVWGMLYKFQKDAALSIINKLEKYNGCILADSVGLGKTFTALAVIKYYETRNKNVLVLCPKKLYNNWDTYRNDYADNPLAADRLNYKVLFHTDLSRNQGMSNGVDLARYNWSNNDLLVIDESHNFRNGGNIDDDDEEEGESINRYERLMKEVIRRGVKTKVLMLSATPVNNRFNDLKNQLQLAYEGQSAEFNAMLDTESDIDKIFRDAQAAYNAWARKPSEERTTQSLLDSLDFDFFKMLDAVTIARSRKHIETYYSTADIGKFPIRLSPISRSPKLTDIKDAISFKDIAEKLLTLNFSVYAPSRYILASRLYKYNMRMKGKSMGISVSGQEKGLCKLMATNLLKRLESSVYSFRLTLERVRTTIAINVEAVADFVANHQERNINNSFDDDFDGDDRESFDCVGNTMPISLADMDYMTWQREMKEDLAVIDLLMDGIKDIDVHHDTKLKTLAEDIVAKRNSPINEGNKKILIFTAFSDTAEYLYTNLKAAMPELGIGMVTGNANKCSFVGLNNDFNSILTLFSPMSKNKAQSMPYRKGEIDVLIGTDCISEGQNLQDCDYLVNYDIHWNPVRIIQRFGRIDRIGSKNDKIQLVNYWPDMELDEYIKLKGRVEARLKALNIVGGGGDDLLAANPAEQADLEYRKQQLLRMQTEVVSIEEMNTGVSITDLGLNEFRLDLLDYIKEHPDVEHAPFGMNAVVKASDNMPRGVIFVLKNINSSVNVAGRNMIHPYYMVYLDEWGGVICNHLSPKRMLDIMRSACVGKKQPERELCQAFNEETDDGRRMNHYSDLLASAVKSIVEVKEGSDIDSLFSVGETLALVGDVKGLNDFELITFLVVR